jgi:type II secretory pathway component GspD/PulD (secretin)
MGINATIKREYKHRDSGRIASLSIILFSILLFLGCKTILPDSGKKADTLQKRELTVAHIDSNKAVSLLSSIGISSVPLRDSNNIVLVSGTAEQLDRAGIVIELIDKNEDYIIENLGPASAVRTLPSNMQIASALGRIRIGTFAEPPEGLKSSQAIIDIQDDSVFAIIPVRFRQPLFVLLARRGNLTEPNLPVITSTKQSIPAETKSSTAALQAQRDKTTSATVSVSTIPSPALQSSSNTVLAVSEMGTSAGVSDKSKTVTKPLEQVNKPDIPKTTRIILQTANQTDNKIEISAQTSSRQPGNGEDILDMALPETVTLVQLLDLAGKHLNLNYVYDPKTIGNEPIVLKLQGTQRGQMKVKDLYTLIQTVLKFRGLAMVRQEKNLVSIVPVDKVLDADPFMIEEPNEIIEIGDTVVTRLFDLQYVDAASIVKLLQNMKLGMSVSTIDNTQMVFVTCYSGRMSRIEQLIDMLDRPGTQRECRFRRLQYVTASFLVGKIRTLAGQLQGISITTSVTDTTTATGASSSPSSSSQPVRVLTSSQPAETSALVKTKAKQPVYIDIDERTNRILMIGYEGELALIEELIDTLDINQSDARIAKTYNVKYLKAQEALEKMRKFEIIGTSSGKGDSIGNILTAEPLAIVLDNTNQLLIKAAGDQHNKISEFLDYIDVTPDDLRSLKVYEIKNVPAESIKNKLAELGLVSDSQTKTTAISSPAATNTNTTPAKTDSAAAATTASAAPSVKTPENVLSPASTATNTLVVTEGTPVFQMQKPQVVVNESSNSLIVKATDQQQAQIYEIIKFMDIKLPGDELSFKIYPLENSSPGHMAEMLERLIKETKDKEDKIVKTPKEEERISIVPDANTFSLITYSSKKNQERLDYLIKSLDKRRPQVLIDVTLVEVSRSDTFEYDLNIVASANDAVTGNVGVSPIQTSTNKSRLEGGFNLLDSSGNPTGKVKAFYTDQKVQALLTSIQQKKYGRILAKPKILVDDGQKGQIATTDETTYMKETVQIPQTGSPITTREYTSVKASIELQITPHISEGDLLRLDVHLSRDDFGSRPDSSAPPDKTTSEINTTVFVPDDRSVILGGMVKLNQSKGGYKVPLLGDIPLIGLLFRTIDNSDVEKKLYVFLKANIVRPYEESQLKDLQVMSDQHQDAFEKSESEFQGYEDIPGIKPQPMQPENVLDGYK